MLDVVKFFTQYKLIRYAMSGGTGATVHLGVVFFLTHLLNVWYLYATSAGFIMAFGVSFVLQKFWTFQNEATDFIRTQGAVFAVVAIINFLLNGFLMSVFVERVGLVPVVAQAVTSILIAGEAFLAYSIIFRPKGASQKKNLMQ